MIESQIYSAFKACYRSARRRTRHWLRSLVDRRPKVVLLVYHRVLPDIRFNPIDTIVSVRAFERQLDEMLRRYPIVSLSTALGKRVDEGPQPGIQIVLTFDDGYWDSYEIVFPLLRRKGVPGLFSVVTGYIGIEQPVWDWEVIRTILARPRITGVEVEGDVVSAHHGEPRRGFALRVIQRMKTAPMGAVESAIQRLRQHAGGGLSLADGADRCMTWDELRIMAQGGMEIAGHGVSHRSLARIGLEDAVGEIRGCKEAIERQIGPCAHFALPFGSAVDYNAEVIDAVRSAGFRRCLLNIHGYNHLGTDAFCLKRIIATENTNVSCLLG